MIELRMTEEQARVVAGACEFYARVRMGQFREIIWNPYMIRDMGDKDYFARRDEAERLLMEARALVYPYLGKHIGASWGLVNSGTLIWRSTCIRLSVMFLAIRENHSATMSCLSAKRLVIVNDH